MNMIDLVVATNIFDFLVADLPEIIIHINYSNEIKASGDKLY